MSILILLLISSVFCSEYVVSHEYVDYLKRTVDWEVEDYENNVFRGWTIDEVKGILGLIPNDEYYPEIENGPTPSSVDWRGANCIHEVKDQGRCGSCWAVSAAGVLSDRCCLHSKDHGWLSSQELVSCDKVSSGCQGGYLNSPFNYALKNGLVPEACFPYKAKDLPCPTKCVGGSDWKKAHVCKPTSCVACTGTAGMKKCLATGPATFGFYVVRSFMNYKSGIYKCETANYIGGHAVEAVGFSDKPECHYVTKNSWGTAWGDKGYFKIACETCKIMGGFACDKF